MNHRALTFVVAAVGLTALAWYMIPPASASVPAPADPTAAPASGTFTQDVIFPIENMTMDWYTELQSGRGAPYAPLFSASENANGLPTYMLARLAWQESHYRQDIIDGTIQSPAGALGIMQIVPRWHPDVNPLDPAASIAYAGRYLRQLYRQFGNWQLSLMAYNWGPGNVSKWQRNGGTVPAETQNYQSQILADLAQVGVTVA